MNTNTLLTSRHIIIVILSCIFVNIVVYAQETKVEEMPIFMYADIDDDNMLDHDEPLVIMEASDYMKLFKSKAPLERMLRGQIKNTEFIVLNNNDMMKLDINQDSAITAADGKSLYKIYFAKVSGTIKDALIATKTEMVDIGKLKAIMLHTNPKQDREKYKEHEAHLQDGDEIRIRSTKEEMPWMGL